jgi:hypothetical protein
MTTLKTVTIAARATRWRHIAGDGSIWRLVSRVWVRGRPAIRLRWFWGTGHGRDDHYYRDARRSRLHSATSGGLRVLQLRTRLLGRLRAEGTVRPTESWPVAPWSETDRQVAPSRATHHRLAGTRREKDLADRLIIRRPLSFTLCLR